MELTEVEPFPFREARRTFTAGEDEQDRLSIRYYRRSGDGALVAKVRFGPKSEGAPGFVHGGGLLTVLDEALGAACWILGHPSMTIRLNTVFRKAVPVGAELTVETAVTRVRRRAVEASGRMVDASGTLFVEGDGSFAILPPERVQAVFG